MAQEYDFHIHSIYSKDCLTPIKQIIKRAKKQGLTGIAITDHNTIKGAVKAKKIAKNLDIIIGAEIKTEIGDIIGLFLKKEIKSRKSLEVIKEIKDQGGITILPHPFKSKKPRITHILNKIDLIEGLNTRQIKKKNILAQKLAKKYKIPAIACSDAHNPFTIGRARTIFKEKNIKKALQKGNFKTKGKEASYLFTHSLSFASELIKKILPK